MYKHITELELLTYTNSTSQFYFQRRMKAILKYCSSHQPLALKCLAVADMCRGPVEAVMAEDVKQITFNQGLFEHFYI